MQFRKLFSADNEQALRPRQRPGSGYIEGRGSYPERRESIADRPQYDEDRTNYASAGQGAYNGRWDSNRRLTRRRMPLTTLEALVQIKANGLASV